MKASLRFLIDVPDEQTLTQLADQTAANLAEHTTVHSHAQAIEEERFCVLWAPQGQPENAEIDHVYAGDPDAARDQIDSPSRVVIGVSRRELELE